VEEVVIVERDLAGWAVKEDDHTQAFSFKGSGLPPEGKRDRRAQGDQDTERERERGRGRERRWCVWVTAWEQ